MLPTRESGCKDSHIFEIRKRWRKNRILSVRKYEYRSPYLDTALEVEDVFIPEPDAALRRTCTYRLGEMGSMDADIDESGNVKAQEPWPVRACDGPLAVAEIVIERLGVEELYYPEMPLRGLVVAPNLLCAVILRYRDAILSYDITFVVHQRKGEIVLVDDDERSALCLKEELPVVLGLHAAAQYKQYNQRKDSFHSSSNLAQR